MSRDILADAARRHAHALPGHILLAAEPSAIPVSTLTVDVLAEQAEEIEASSKYALRAMLNGIETVEDLHLFLGLDEGDTARVVAALLVAEFIDYRPPPEGGARRLSLLPEGQEAARDAHIRRPKSTAIQVVYDRLTKAVTEWRKSSLRRASQAKSDAGRILMPPSTSMPVQLEDLSVATISSALGSRRDVFRILGVSGLTENRNYYHDAILLVFKDIDSNTLRLGVEVDGVWSEPHTAALEAIGAVERLGLSAVPVEDPHEPVGDPGKRLTRDEVITLQTAMSDHPGNDDDADRLARSAIRWLGVYEHPKLLDDALTNSQRRLLIISPWITQSVVNAQWVSRLEQLARTADVTIFWGFGDNEKTDTTAVELLHAAARRSQRLAIVKVDNTHAKVLVSDSFYIKTSFNWLSFRADPSRRYRQEEGDLVQDQALSDGAYDRYMTENCTHAVEVVGTLPPQYRGLVCADVAAECAVKASTDSPTQARGKTMKKGDRDSKPHAGSGLSARKRAALQKLAVGQMLSGAIKNITSFGAFVDLGDVDGLIHISRISKHRIEHPSEVVAVGDEVAVMVVDVDVEKGRVSLALKTI